MVDALPDDVELARTTKVFDEVSVPPGLLREHRIAPHTWGRLVVHGGTVRLVFEDDSGEALDLDPGDTGVIAPDRPHHVELGVGARFAVEFHRHPDSA
ncbi:MAG: DUF1971 domain-containing protein [Acidimicrobiales bacterium]|nr:DUF1971 domain-containing protein [Acidimicrobiales bacterium]